MMAVGDAVKNWILFLHALMKTRKEIEILMVEDVPADVVMVNRELRKGGLNFRSKRVDSPEAFLNQLQQDPPDLILSDHGLPSFDGFTALAIAQDQCPDVPFIFVAGALNEQMIIDAFKGGATDYVLKSQLTRVVPAVQRALRSSGSRAQMTPKERALVESEERFRMLVDGVKDYAIFMLDAFGRVTSWNAGAQHLHGHTAEEMLGQNFKSLYLREDIDRGLPERALKTAGEEGRFEEAGWRVHKSGEKFQANVVITVLRDEQGRLRGFAHVTRDVTARSQAEEALRKSEALKTAILETALDAILSIDQEGLVQEWNPAAQRIFGYQRNEALGRPMEELIVPPALREVYEDGLTNYLMTGVGSLLDRPVELTLRRADGSEFRAELAITRVSNEEPSRCTALIRDITQRKRAEEMIWELNSTLERRVLERTADLEAANHDLEAFLYSVPHDLQGPLRHLTAYVEILQREADGTLSRSSKECLLTIARAARQLGHWLDALLAFSRMGRSEMCQQRVRLTNLVEEARRALSHDIEDRNITWHIHELPEVDGDPLMLREVIVNLLSNALKYTRPRENPKIEIGALESQEETIVFVHDNGVGFDPKYSDQLFGVFTRLHPPAEFEGIGIGLANVRRIVRRHAGRVWAEGVVDAGATFYFSLPKLLKARL